MPCFLAAAVPILASLSRDEKLTLLDAFEEKSFRPGDTVVRQVRGADNAAACLHLWLRWCLKGACCARVWHLYSACFCNKHFAPWLTCRVTLETCSM